MVLAYSPDQLVAFWTAVAALATVLAGGVGIVTLVALKADSRERARPVIGADFEPLPLVRGSTELVISNFGVSVAKNVKITFSPDIPGDAKEIEFGSFIGRRYASPIATFPPGRVYRNVYSQLDMTTGEQREPMPQQLKVSISYQDSRGKPYSDSYDLDVNNVALQTDAKPSTPGNDAQIRRLVEAAEALARGLGR